MATAFVRINNQADEGQLGRRVRDKKFTHHHHHNTAPHIRVNQRNLTAEQPRQRKLREKRRPANFISTDGTTSGDDCEEMQYNSEQEVQAKLDQLLKKSDQLASDLEADCEDNNSTDVDTVSVSGSIKHKNGVEKSCEGEEGNVTMLTNAATSLQIEDREKILNVKIKNLEKQLETVLNLNLNLKRKTKTLRRLP
uniref:Uncharacterized protein n=1 Tax=Ditylenchus dipsaci TaxID=166011 RepID=A0A915CLL3_9BILA